MKITKRHLNQIIKEEIEASMAEIRDLGGEDPPTPGDVKFSGRYEQAFDEPETIYQPPGVMGPPSPDVSLEALWRDLNSLLARWSDKKHKYYHDLYYVMEAYSTSPDRPSLPPESEESEEDRWAAIERGVAP